MKRIDSLLLIALGAGTVLLEARWITAPGYMDSDYYTATGLSLADGRGFEEPFLWNYLDDPQAIPHPSHSYWMPVPSVLAAVGGVVIGPSFLGARVMFLGVFAVVPWLTFSVASRIGSNRAEAWLASLLSAAPGFYAPYFLTTDAFGLFAILGGVLCLTVTSRIRPGLRWLACGALVGAAHLTRADGPLLLLPVAVAFARESDRRWRGLLLIGLGYAVVLTPWWLRNLGAFGSLWPPGGIRALWLTAYDELFLYPAGQLTADRWLQQGVAQLLEQRWEALLANLLSLGAVNGSVFLAPLMVSGLTGRAKSGVVSGMAAYLACLLVLMSLVFPFAGGRGGFFHSSAAAMPLMWAAAPQGLTRVLAWGERVRGWNRQLGWRLLGGAAVAFAVLLTAYVFRQRVVGPMPARPNWALSARTYAVLQSEFFSSLPEGRVAVNNPPGFYLATRREAIVIPDGGIDELAQAASAYGVRWVVLEANHPRGWNQFYSAPSSLPGLKWFATTSDEDGQAIYLLEFEAPMSGATP